MIVNVIAVSRAIFCSKKCSSFGNVLGVLSKDRVQENASSHTAGAIYIEASIT